MLCVHEPCRFAFNDSKVRQGNSVLVVQPALKYTTITGRTKRTDETSKFAQDINTAMIHGVIKAGFRAVVFVPGTTEQAAVDSNVKLLQETEVFNLEFFGNWRNSQRYGAAVAPPHTTSSMDCNSGAPGVDAAEPAPGRTAEV